MACTYLELLHYLLSVGGMLHVMSCVKDTRNCLDFSLDSYSYYYYGDGVASIGKLFKHSRNFDTCTAYEYLLQSQK